MKELFETYTQMQMIEAKQVGVLYHFTNTIQALRLFGIDKEWQFEPFVMMSKNGYISTTRNAGLPSDFNSKQITDKNGYIVRIALDGNKISEKYKITPINGLDTDDDPLDMKNMNRMSRREGESEELIHAMPFNIKPYILNVTVYSRHSQAKFVYDKLKPILDKYNIPHTYSKVWGQVEEGFSGNIFDYKFNYGIIP